MFPPRFLSDRVPTKALVVFHRIDARSYLSILKKLVALLLYLVLELDHRTNRMLVHFHNAHTHKYGADTQLFLWGALLTVLLAGFQFLLAMKKNSVPQQQQHSGRKISQQSTLPNSLRVFPGCPGCPPGFRFGAWLSPS